MVIIINVVINTVIINVLPNILIEREEGREAVYKCPVFTYAPSLVAY